MIRVRYWVISLCSEYSVWCWRSLPNDRRLRHWMEVPAEPPVPRVLMAPAGVNVRPVRRPYAIGYDRARPRVVRYRNA